MQPTDEDLRELARMEYVAGDGQIQIDDDAKVSRPEGGTEAINGVYVQAWVYVSLEG